MMENAERGEYTAAVRNFFKAIMTWRLQDSMSAQFERADDKKKDGAYLRTFAEVEDLQFDMEDALFGASVEDHTDCARAFRNFRTLMDNFKEEKRIKRQYTSIVMHYEETLEKPIIGKLIPFFSRTRVNTNLSSFIIFMYSQNTLIGNMPIVSIQRLVHVVRASALSLPWNPWELNSRRRSSRPSSQTEDVNSRTIARTALST